MTSGSPPSPDIASGDIGDTASASPSPDAPAEAGACAGDLTKTGAANFWSRSSTAQVLKRDQKLGSPPSVEWPGAPGPRAVPPLLAGLLDLDARSAARLPGRLDALLTARFAKLRGLAEPDDPDGVRAAPLTTAEAAAVDLAERFMLDIRGVTPELIGELLLPHFTDDEGSAILFRLAMLEGVAKLARIFPRTQSVMSSSERV